MSEPTPGIPALIAVQFPKAWPTDPEHWLNWPEHKWFRDAWAYASTQTLAIPGLSEIGPADLYYVHAALRRGGQPPSDGMPSEPSEAAIEAAMSFADGDAASHTSIRGSDYSRKEWTRLFLAAAYAAERGVSAVPPNQE